MQLNEILNQIRINQLLRKSITDFDNNFTTKNKEWTLIEIKRLPDGQNVNCESEKINGKTCGRPIRNIMVVEDKHGQILNIGTSCYQQAMGINDTRCPKASNFKDRKVDARLLKHYNADLKLALNEVEVKLPQMVKAANMMGNDVTVDHFKDLLDSKNYKDAITELVDIQHQFKNYREKRIRVAKNQPTYVKKFDQDIARATQLVNTLRNQLAPMELRFNESLFNTLESKGFTEQVITEVFKHFNKDVPTSKITTMARKTPW